MTKGTFLYRELLDARKNYNEGLPVSARVIVEELELHIKPDWKEVYELISPMGEEMIDSQVDIPGENDDYPIPSPRTIIGFSPQKGHEYLIRARRYRIIDEPMYYSYELIEILSDRDKSIKDK